MSESSGESSAATPSAASVEAQCTVAELVSSRLRDVPDFPQPGVLFKDFTPLLADGAAFASLVRDIGRRYEDRIDVVVGIEARGFVLAAPVAYELGLGMVLVRKAGKLPGEVLTERYSLEYGTAQIEVSTDAFQAGQRVLVLDDVLATGGTAAACCQLIERAGAQVVAVDVVLELSFLHGRDRLTGRVVHATLTL